MYVHTLEFTDRDHLAAAFERLALCEQVEDCLVEANLLRIRFVAPPEPAATLVERIYQDGGLRLSLRHYVVGGTIPAAPERRAPASPR
jgi:hypothetical protein